MKITGWMRATVIVASWLAPATARAQKTDSMPGMSEMAAHAAKGDTGSAAHAKPADDLEMHMAGVFGIPHTRLGSGTSWQPEAAPHYGWHFLRGGWSLMVHGVAYAEYDKQLGARGDDQVGSINWGMLMAMHSLWGGMLHLHGMLSAEPATIGSEGYPLLLQTGESYRGEPLHDRQHPHDLFMEAAALYEHQITHKVALSLYLAPVGDPAIGPVAFPHRSSAASDPLAPLGHHWEDATHITFGVITLGMFSRTWKVEGSIFNGREPDEHRTNFDMRKLDSYSGRIFYNPNTRWSYSASTAYLASPEGLHPQESMHRYSASIMNTRLLGERGEWSTSLIYGANKLASVPLSSSALVESDFSVDGVNTFFGRAEYAQKSAQDLVLADQSELTRFDVGALTLGYSREILRARGLMLGASILGTINAVPETLRSAYGTRYPKGYAVFLRLRPDRMHSEKGMTGM